MYLRSSSPIRHRFNAQINIPITLSFLILPHVFRPSLHILVKGIDVFLTAQVNGFLILSNLSNLRSSRYVGGTEVVLVYFLLNRTFDLAGEDVAAEIRFLTNGAGKAYSIDRVQCFYHCADGFETACYVSPCFCEA
jgi:hypothetical protein